MRNLLALALAFGLTTAASAQNNSATVSQTGSSNAADVDQAGGATATVTQSLEDNVADIDQVGASTVTLVQATATDRFGNQTDGHSATIQQIGGDGNIVNLYQGTSSNSLGAAGSQTADIFQDGSDNVVAGSFDGLDPAVQDSRSDADADIDQLGNRNFVDFEDGNELTVLQDGDDNFAQTQGGGVVDIDQIGNNNDATSMRIRTSTIYQQGDDNEATARAFGASADNTVDISQVGNHNIATAEQFRTGTFLVDQDGDWNSATVDLGSGSGGSAGTTAGLDYDITQNANGFGAAGASNSFDATVRFNDNTATVDQELTGAGMNSISLDQLSAGNTATLTQIGVGNAVTTTQN
ncbi:MAG: hypothetical protein AAGJ11_03040 [Bacteroidota bacterium]